MYISRIIALSVGFIAGIIYATFMGVNFPWLTPIMLSIFFICSIYGAVTLFREFKWRESSPLSVFLPMVIAGLSLGIMRTSAVISPDSSGSAFFHSCRSDELLNIRGEITAEPELRSSHTLNLYVRISQIKKDSESCWHTISPEEVRVTVYRPRAKKLQSDFEKLTDLRSYGDMIEFTALYRPLNGIYGENKVLNPGGFNMKLFLMGEGCIASLRIYDWKESGKRRGTVDKITPGDGFFLMRWALAAKRSFLKTYKYAIPSPESRLVAGATLGARFALRGERYRGAVIEDIFRHSGVGHVLAVSGLHVSVVSLLLYSLFRLSRMSPRYFSPLLIFFLFLFTMLTGARPSSLRAAIMNAVVILIFVYGRSGFKRATCAGVAISALFILFRRPMVLYSAGFLLSFGAVLSLILIAPPAERILRELRGAVFGMVIIWGSGVVVFASLFWEFFLRWEIVILLSLLLWGMISIGSFINRKIPSLLIFRFDRMPEIIRFFIAAQLAIQIGMMIPMSAFFFGSFPIAGIFVNLIAIPLVGIIVQLGIIIGLAGMIPGIFFPALIFGAAEWLVAHIFILAAWAGSVVFPYPPVPKPSAGWMICYYTVLALLLSVELWFQKLRTLIYQLKAEHSGQLNAVLAAGCLAVGGVALHRIALPPLPSELTVDVLSGTSTPVVAVTGSSNGAVIINSGNSFFASRELKNLILARGEISVKCAFASGRAPSDGAEGFAELAKKIPLKKVWFPAFLSPPEFSQRGDLTEMRRSYFSGIGIDNTKKISNTKSRWLKRCADAYGALSGIIPAEDLCFYSASSSVIMSDAVRIDVLSENYETYPAALMCSIGSERVLVTGDPSAKSITSIPAELLQCDCLVLPLPLPGRREYYMRGLAYIIEKGSPKRIILSIDESNLRKQNKDTLPKILSLCGTRNILRTDQQAVSFTVSSD